MDLLWMVNKIRYMKPVNSFLEMLPATFFLGTGTYIVNLFLDIFYTKFELILLLVLSIIADLATAVWSNKIRKNPITSLGIRQTTIKFVEYFVFLLVLTGISNVFGSYDTESSSFIMKGIAAMVKDLDAFGFFLLIWTELISISENMMDNDGAMSKIIAIIKDRIDNLFNKNKTK